MLDKLTKTLYYYHNPREDQPRRAIDITTCTITRLTRDESSKYPGFKIIVPDVREFLFIGNNPMVIEEWLNALFQVKSPSYGARSFGLTGSASMVQSGTGEYYTQGNLSSRYSQISASAASQKRESIMPSSQRASYMSRAPTEYGTNPNSTGNNDTNATLVAEGADPKGVQFMPVPVIVLISESNKFAPIEKPVIGILTIGRYLSSQIQNENMITFNSKVISRHHAEIWGVNGEIYVRDAKSQSGTFLNAMRLSEPARESKPYRLKSGDILQFGVDYKGATEDSAKCVTVRVDIQQKILEIGPMRSMVGMGQGAGDKDETLVGGASNSKTLDGTTFIGNGTKMNEQTLFKSDQAAAQIPPIPGNIPNGQSIPNNYGQAFGISRPQLIGGSPQIIGGDIQ